MGLAPGAPSAARKLQAGPVPQPVRPVHARLVAGASQEDADADAPVAVARVLARQGLHRLDHGCVLGTQAKLVAQARARQAGEPAGAPLGQSALASERDRLASRLRAHHVFALISLSTEMSRPRSASKRSSRAFSASRGAKAFDVGRGKLTEVLAPGMDGLLADLVLLGHRGHRRRVGLAQDGDHLLVAESALPHGLLAVEEPSSQELSVRGSRAGHSRCRPEIDHATSNADRPGAPNTPNPPPRDGQR